MILQRLFFKLLIFVLLGKPWIDWLELSFRASRLACLGTSGEEVYRRDRFAGAFPVGIAPVTWS